MKNTTYPKNQTTVIDAYTYLANGWTYSYTLLTNKDVYLSTEETFEELYLTRVLKHDPKPLQYLNDNKSEIEPNIVPDYED
tara:strand:- start:311 stop:553 length:243 start_codon:yes stop_codon:yes gene_type:complete